MNNTKQIEWRHAFLEWHRHRTNLTAAQEIKARQELLVSIREQRRKWGTP